MGGLLKLGEKEESENSTETNVEMEKMMSVRKCDKDRCMEQMPWSISEVEVD